MPARLVFRDTSGADRVVDLPEGGGAGCTVEIGRGDGCLVQIADASMSRRHATLRVQDGRWIVADNTSTGGTFVNEQRVNAATLTHGDWIRCGVVYLQFQALASAPEPAAPGPSAAATLVGVTHSAGGYGAPPPVASPAASPVASQLQAQPAQPAQPAQAGPQARSSARNPSLFRSRHRGYVFTDGYTPTVENLDRVLNFLPIFEDTSRPFYSVEGVGGDFKYRFSTEVHRFIQVAVEQGLIVESQAVEWLRYKHPIYRNPLHIDTADLSTCQRLLTAFVDDSPEVPINLAQALHAGLFVRVLYRLRALRDELASDRRCSVESGRIEILYADLTGMGIDAAVIPTDERLSGSGGLDAAIRMRAGGELQSYCQRLGSLPTTEARLLPGFLAPPSYLIFTVGPRWGGGDYGEDALLIRCYESCLRLCIEKDLHTVAFPAIATGAMGFPPARAAQLALAAVRRALATTDKLWKVYFTCHDAETHKAFVAALDTPVDVLSAAAARATASAPAGAQAGGPTGTAPSATSLPSVAASREAPAQVRGTLPNPEGRPVSVFLTQNFLQNSLFAEVTLEAYRMSRGLLNDPRSHIKQLDDILRALRTARTQGAAEELAQLGRWSFDGQGGPADLEALRDRANIVVRGAPAAQQASCLYGLRVFLRALRDAYLVQGRFFAMTHKTETDGKPNQGRPSLRELPDAWAAVHLGAIVQFRAQRVLAQEPTSFESSTSVQLWTPEAAAPFSQVIRALSIGAAALCGGGEDYFLLVGYVGSLDRFYCLRPLTGAAEFVARQRLARAQSPLDYLCLVDPALDSQAAKLGLSAVSPDT